MLLFSGIPSPTKDVGSWRSLMTSDRSWFSSPCCKSTTSRSSRIAPRISRTAPTVSWTPLIVSRTASTVWPIAPTISTISGSSASLPLLEEDGGVVELERLG